MWNLSLLDDECTFGWSRGLHRGRAHLDSFVIRPSNEVVVPSCNVYGAFSRMQNGVFVPKPSLHISVGQIWGNELKYVLLHHLTLKDIFQWADKDCHWGITPNCRCAILQLHHYRICIGRSRAFTKTFSHIQVTHRSAAINTFWNIASALKHFSKNKTELPLLPSMRVTHYLCNRHLIWWAWEVYSSKNTQMLSEKPSKHAQKCRTTFPCVWIILQTDCGRYCQSNTLEWNSSCPERPPEINSRVFLCPNLGSRATVCILMEDIKEHLKKLLGRTRTQRKKHSVRTNGVRMQSYEFQMTHEIV